VYSDRRWYVVAFDLDRDGWRTFRIDRMSALKPTGTRCSPRADTPDALTFVAEGLAVGGWDVRSRVRLHVPLDQARRSIAPTDAVLTAETSNTTIAEIGGDLDWTARLLAGLACRCDVLDPPELSDELRLIGEQLVAAHSRLRSR
jgi:predicted DNA-binding transcriptional regulator YafY